MASTAIVVNFLPGLSGLYLQLKVPTATALAETVSLTESALAGTYEGTADEALAGEYVATLVQGGGVLASGRIALQDDLGPYAMGNDVQVELAKVVKSGEQRTLTRTGKDDVTFTETRG